MKKSSGDLIEFKEYLDLKLDNHTNDIRNDIKAIHTRLDILNGQVPKNTKARELQRWINYCIAGLLVLLIFGIENGIAFIRLVLTSFFGGITI